MPLTCTFSANDINVLYNSLLSFDREFDEIKKMRKVIKLRKASYTNNKLLERFMNVKADNFDRTMSFSEDSASFYSCVSYEETVNADPFQDNIEALNECEKRNFLPDNKEVLHYFPQKIRVFVSLSSLAIVLPDPRPLMASHITLNLSNICMCSWTTSREKSIQLSLGSILIEDKMDILVNFESAANSINTEFSCLYIYSHEWNECYMRSCLENDDFTKLINTKEEHSFSRSIYSADYYPLPYFDNASESEGF